jgi:hypothetical protein
MTFEYLVMKEKVMEQAGKLDTDRYKNSGEEKNYKRDP